MWHIQEQELSPCGVQEGLALFYSLKFPSHAGAAANICSAGSLMLLHAFQAACTPEGCRCWSRSVPLLPHFTTLEFKQQAEFGHLALLLLQGLKQSHGKQLCCNHEV